MIRMHEYIDTYAYVDTYIHTHTHTHTHLVNRVESSSKGKIILEFDYH
jgi:hypothetical protein